MCCGLSLLLTVFNASGVFLSLVEGWNRAQGVLYLVACCHYGWLSSVSCPAVQEQERSSLPDVNPNIRQALIYSAIACFPTSQPAARDMDCLCGLIGIVMLLYSATLAFRSREAVIMTLKHGLTTQRRQKSQWTERTIPLGLLVKGNKA